MTTTTTIILKTRRLRGSMSVYSSSGGSPECMGQLDPVTHATFGALPTHRVLKCAIVTVYGTVKSKRRRRRVPGHAPGKESRRQL
jgi:hypothetical protein